jgi:hypothetical protein
MWEGPRVGRGGADGRLVGAGFELAGDIVRSSCDVSGVAVVHESCVEMSAIGRKVCGSAANVLLVFAETMGIGP